MRVGIIGTGAIAGMHARAYKNIGYSVRVCTNVTADKGRAFAAAHGAEFVERYEDVCRHPEVDFVDVCTFPSFRLDVVRACAESRKPVQVQKPMSTTLDTAREMLDVARRARAFCSASSASIGSIAPASFCLPRSGGPARKAAAVRRLREVVAIRRVLRASGERQLGDRRRRSADQSGDPSGRSAAVVCRSCSRAVRPCGRSAPPTRSSPRTSSMR